MPIVNIHLMAGRSDDLKRQLVAKVTEAVCEAIDVLPKDVRIILSEMEENHYSVAGTLKMDKV